MRRSSMPPELHGRPVTAPKEASPESPGAAFPDVPASPPEVAAPAKRRKGAGGRVVGLTPRIQKIICDAIAVGNYQKVAARAAGISEEWLLKWRQKGRKGIEPYASLEKAIEDAGQKCETALVAKVMAATSSDWRAAAMMLERKYPERWSKMRDEDGRVNVGSALQINLHLGPDPEWQRGWDEQVQRRQLELAKKPEQLN